MDTKRIPRAPTLALVPVLLAALASCAAPAPNADGRWYGTLTPAPARPGCTIGRASLVVRRAVALFNPNEGTWTLEGRAAPDGSVSAERGGMGANKQAFTTTFSGHATPATVTGTYTTPQCTFTVALRQP